MTKELEQVIGGILGNLDQDDGGQSLKVVIGEMGNNNTIIISSGGREAAPVSVLTQSANDPYIEG